MTDRCPDPEPNLADILITPWQNFDGEHGDYRQHMIALGVPVAPAHARIEITHSCGWALSLRPGTHSAERVVTEIAEHLGVPLVSEVVAQAATKED
jgi:hypothetical protein